MEQHPRDLPKLSRRCIKLEPNLPQQREAFDSFCAYVADNTASADAEQRKRILEHARDAVQSMGGAAPSKDQIALKLACSVVIDIVAQGWELTVKEKAVELRSPSTEGVAPEELKNRIRAGHLLERDSQLRQPSVREFIGTMEQRRLHVRGWTSIFSLMRDGRELADSLQEATSGKSKQESLSLLRKVVSPYLQVVDADSVCEHTGLKIANIWRYFRHTWVSTYKSLPGRGMAVLVRDSAAPNHPVIGIAALGNSTAQQTIRDEWIGWDADAFLEMVVAKPTKKIASWALNSVERLIKSLYVADLQNDGVIERYELRKPNVECIDRLLKAADAAAELHRLFPNVDGHKSSSAKLDWKKQANTSLFRAKRARTLAKLLSIRKALTDAGFAKASQSSLKHALASSEARTALRQLVRLVKAEHVGIDMMDIIICGAVAPYNAVLGGKLVCMLLASPEIVKHYRERYAVQESVIASSMQGRSVTRKPNLVLLGTTSLYGVGSSQYNRIHVPLDQLGRASSERIEYLELGISKGYGSYQFSQATIDYLEIFLGRSGGGRRVNSIFGEGVNPLMRKLRDGLALIGFPTDELLNHGNPRVVYSIALASNFREVLLGFSDRPKYLLSLRQAKDETEKLAEYWRTRWLVGRVSRENVLPAVRKHVLSYPVSHGARVALPEDEPSLFDM